MRKSSKQLFQNITDAVYYLKIYEDGTAGEFIEVNEVGYTRLGYTRDEILRMTPFDIDHHKKEEDPSRKKMTFISEFLNEQIMVNGIGKDLKKYLLIF